MSPPTLYSPGVMEDAPWQDGYSNHLKFEDHLFLAYIVFTVLVVWRVGFGSGRRLGFVSGASGSRRKPSLGIRNPDALTTKLMTTKSYVESYVVDHGFR